MRKRVITVLLILLLAGWGVMLGLQKRAAHQAPAVAALPASASASASGSAKAPEAGSASASATPPGSATPSADADAGTDAGADADAPKLMDRPLRVIALGWDLGAAGLLANGGVEPSAASDFTAAGLDARVAVAASTTSLEAALARGGEDKDGADIAILPLPTFVASYERLRALSLDIFFVTGWSRGHEGIASVKPEWPAKGEVKLAGGPGEPATFLALWAFELTGTPAAQVKLAPPSAPVADAPFAAVDRSSPLPDSSRNALLLTTADAPRLVPYVAVAPAGLIEQRSRALVVWADTWLKGARKLAQDAPAGARAVAGTKGAPEPIALLQELGQSAPATLADNVRAAGLSGRSAITLEALFQRSWALWRAASVLATPSPDAAPVVTGVISALARAEPGQAAGAPADDAKPRDAGSNAKVLIAYRQPEGKLDEAALVATAGFLAGAFERAPLRLAVGSAVVDKARTKKALEDAQGRFGLAPGRIAASAKGLPQSSASIEVLSVP